jgi:hypothetical protein
MDSNFICYVIYFTVQYSCGKHRNPGARKLSIIYGSRRSFLAAAKVVDGDDHCVCLRPSFCSAWNVNTSSNLDFALLCLFCTYRALKQARFAMANIQMFIFFSIS